MKPQEINVRNSSFYDTICKALKSSTELIQTIEKEAMRSGITHEQRKELAGVMSQAVHTKNLLTLLNKRYGN